MNQTESVERFLEDIASLPNNFHAILVKLREHFMTYGPDLDEVIKYGGLAFLRDGKLIGGLYVYKNHMAVELSHGSELDDPDNILEGTGKFRRHIKFTSLSDIERKNAAEFIEKTCDA
jgi:hypothetical protein